MTSRRDKLSALVCFFLLFVALVASMSAPSLSSGKNATAVNRPFSTTGGEQTDCAGDTTGGS